VIAYAGKARDASVVFVGRVETVRIRSWPSSPQAWRTRDDHPLLAVYTVDVLEVMKGTAQGLVVVEQTWMMPIHCWNDFPNDTLTVGQQALFMTERVGDTFNLLRGAMAHVPLPADAAAADVAATVVALLGSNTANPGSES
jgi:hypothetical protein